MSDYFDEYGRPLPNDDHAENTKEAVPSRLKKFKSSVLSRSVASICALALVFGTVSGGTFYGVNSLLSSRNAGIVQNTSLSLMSAQNTGSLDVSGIAKATLPSVASITNKSVQEVQDWFFYFMNPYGSPTQLQESTSVGSGVIINQSDDYLYIVTNYHVIKGATTLSATFVNDSTCEAEYVGGDETNDIALLRINISNLDKDTLDSISIAAIGDSTQLEVGEQVVAIGNALGYGQSVTTGIVSAVDRTIETDEYSGYAQSQDPETYIQTDAAINPGNSGGALLNMNGEVIGINTAKLASTEVEGMGYAIPIDRVADIVNSILSTERSKTSQSL